MNNCQILDCTLRDGGYINSWKFGKDRIKNIISGLVAANIDIIELGFLTKEDKDEQFSLYSSSKDLDIAACKQKGRTLYAAMIAMGEDEIDLSKISDANDSLMDIVRITFHGDKEEIKRAFNYADKLQRKGYLVCMQPVGTKAYTDEYLIQLMSEINQLKPFAFYIVDTLGNMNKHDLLRFMYLFDSNLAPEIKIGFHSHNNLQLALSNAQEMIRFETDRDIIIDSSVFGMGRGAGNLCTEAICDYYNNQFDDKYEIMSLFQIIDEELISIFAEKSWGYTPAYFMSASKNCHPNYSTFLLSKQSVRAGEIGRLLEKIPVEKRMIYHRELIEEIYQNYQQHSIDDSQAINALSKIFNDKDVLIIAPGVSISKKQDEIKQFINDKKPVVVSINFLPPFPVDNVFVSNKKRFKTFNDIDPEKWFFTSNIVDLPEDTMKVNYIDLVNSTPEVSDNSGLMLMKFLSRMNVNGIFLAGFDGFLHNQLDNYYNHSLIGVLDVDDMDKKNQAFVTELKKLQNSVSIEFITDSLYVDMIKG